MQGKSDNFHNFKERLSELRWKLRWTRDQMGQKFGVTGHYLYLVESGKKPPTTKLLVKVESLEKQVSEKSEELFEKTSDQNRLSGVQSMRTHQPQKGGRMKYPTTEEGAGSVIHDKAVEDAAEKLAELKKVSPEAFRTAEQVISSLYKSTVRKGEKGQK